MGGAEKAAVGVEKHGEAWRSMEKHGEAWRSMEKHGEAAVEGVACQSPQRSKAAPASARGSAAARHAASIRSNR